MSQHIILFLKGDGFIRRQIEKRIAFIEKEMGEAKERLKALPDGKLVVTKNGPYSKWYVSNGDDLVYIPKKQRILAEDLLRKKWFQFNLSMQKSELRMLKSISDLYAKYERLEREFWGNEGYWDLMVSHYKNSLNGDDWMRGNYEKCEKYPENLVFKTTAGIMVRSKSEAMIVSELCHRNIAFRYEEKLVLDEIEVYPDFTIKRGDDTLVYWEHFGMMDDPAYARNAFRKLEMYASAGVVIDINLIATFETRDNPLDPYTIKRKIEEFL